MDKGKLVKPIDVLELLISENWTKTEVGSFGFYDFCISDSNKLLIYDSINNRYSLYEDASLYLNDLKRSLRISAHPPLTQRQEDLKNISEREHALLAAFYIGHSLPSNTIPTPGAMQRYIKQIGIDDFYENYYLELILYIGNYLKATILPNAKWETYSKDNCIIDLYLLTREGERVSITKKVNRYYFEKRSIPIGSIINELSIQ